MNIPNLKQLRPSIREKSTKHIKKLSKFLYNYGDPIFIDERKDFLKDEEKIEPKKKSFIDSLISFF